MQIFLYVNGVTLLCTCVPSRYYYEGEEEKGKKGCMTYIIASDKYVYVHMREAVGDMNGLLHLAFHLHQERPWMPVL